MKLSVKYQESSETMIFLIHYNRSAGEIMELKQFKESQRVEAEDARLKMKLDLIGKKDGMKCVCSRRAVSKH